MSASLIMDATDLIRQTEKELTHNILPYWLDKMVDHEFGGFYGRRDGHDVLDEQADKGVILNTRILWTFSHVVNTFRESGVGQIIPPLERYASAADRAYQYIVDKFIDHHRSGVFWMVDYLGNPVTTKKQIYAQAFAIYAFSEYFNASKRKEALEKAIQLFHDIEKYSFDPHDNGYFEAYDREWNLLQDLRLSDKDANEKKTMNTHLHILEAYTNLYKHWKDEHLKKQLRNLILVFREKIVTDNFHFQLFFDEKWNVKSHHISFGHDIEGSWLLYEAAEILGDEELLREIKELSVKMVDQALLEGMDSDGGLMNEGNELGVQDTDKHWWPQAEALVGITNAWQLTRDTRYWEAMAKSWSFIQDKLIDRENGEWHWRVNRAGQVNFTEDKTGPWKCPYHNGRAMLEVMKRLSRK